MSATLAISFEVGKARCHGIVLKPDSAASVGIVIVVGGPQYRVGSHRYFVLLARALQAAGYPVLRFDYRGMGDSEGEPVNFENCQDDIRAAIDALQATTGVSRVVLWGLCDGASAAMMYAPTDRRVVGVAALNPWLRSDASLAQTHLRNYYLQRLRSAEFWRTTMRSFPRLLRSGRELLASMRRAWLHRDERLPGVGEAVQDFRERMRRGVERFNGPLLIQISGSDLTAAEFVNVSRADRAWRKALQQCKPSYLRIEGADHTLSSSLHQQQANDGLIGWLTKQRFS